MLRALRRFAQLPHQRKVLLLEACVALASAAFRVQRIPFRQLARRLGTSGCESPQELPDAQDQIAREVEWALVALSRRLARILPRPPTCLMLASAGQTLLRRRRVPATVYLGVGSEAPTDGRTFDAHAWLRCGTRIVTGKAEAARFKPLAWFSTGTLNYERGNIHVP